MLSYSFPYRKFSWKHYWKKNLLNARFHRWVIAKQILFERSLSCWKYVQSALNVKFVMSVQESCYWWRHICEESLSMTSHEGRNCKLVHCVLYLLAVKCGNENIRDPVPMTAIPNAMTWKYGYMVQSKWSCVNPQQLKNL